MPDTVYVVMQQVGKLMMGGIVLWLLFRAFGSVMGRINGVDR